MQNNIIPTMPNNRLQMIDPVEGQIVYDTTNDCVVIYYDGVWMKIYEISNTGMYELSKMNLVVSVRKKRIMLLFFIMFFILNLVISLCLFDIGYLILCGIHGGFMSLITFGFLRYYWK